MSIENDYLPQFRRDWGTAPGPICLLVIDLQYATASRHHGLGRLLAKEGRQEIAGYRFDRIEASVVPNTVRLLEQFRQNDMPVVYLSNGSRLPDYSDMSSHLRDFAKYVGIQVGSKEYEILEEVRPERQCEIVFTKTTAGGFHSTAIDTFFRTVGIRKLVVVGVSTNACVDTTARGAAEHGYETLLVSDACTATHQDLHNGALRSFERQFGMVRSTQYVIDHIGRSG